MKNILIILTALYFLAGFTTKKPEEINRFKKKYAALYDGIYMGKYEVTNAEYQLFLQSQKGNLSPAEFSILQIEENCFEGLNPKLRVFSRMYATNDAYKNYPVVGISYAAATAYCNWLTGQNEKKK